jgi:hypothetical protein
MKSCDDQLVAQSPCTSSEISRRALYKYILTIASRPERKPG